MTPTQKQKHTGRQTGVVAPIAARGVAIAVLMLLAGLAAETAQGLRTLLVDSRAYDLIVPLTGLTRRGPSVVRQRRFALINGLPAS